ncbi:MAG: hypothetical protein KGK07_13580 [Chloroflexota bacterium]|nr:hypothetical protein [Chloroflexota bacterium]
MAFLVNTNEGGNFNLALADGGTLPVQTSGTIGPGTGPNPAVNQTAWFQSYATGNNANDGKTAASPVKTAAEILRRWQGGVNGTRPVLPGITITITGLDSAPDASDPWNVLLDVDQIAPGQVILQCQPVAPLHTGTLATVSAFARTSAAGQIIITAADAPNWNAFPMPSLFLDTTKTSVGWLYEPFTGSSANGIITPCRTPATPATTVGESQLLATAGDAYQLVPLVSIYMGGGARYRTFPSPILGNGASATIRRMRIIKSPGASFESVQIVPENGASVWFQECQIDPEPLLTNFTFLQNCWTTTFIGSSQELDQNNTFLWAGGSYAALSVQQGLSIVESDFVFDTAQNGGTAIFLGRGVSSAVRIAQASTWGLAVGIVTDVGSTVRIAGITASDIFYGKVGGANPIFNANENTLVQARAGDSTFASAFNFDTTAFQCTSNGTQGFGFNLATGAWVGPTTFTTAHVDAALAAGTGFGGAALFPPTGTVITNTNG